MKVPSKMFRVSILGKVAAGAALALAALVSLSVQAQEVKYITSYTGSTLTPAPTFSWLAGSYSTFGSTAISSPPNVPTRTRTVYGYSTDFSWSIQPPTTLAGATYKIETAHTTATTSADVRVTAYSTDGTVTSSCTNTAAFDASHGGNTWQLIGYITNNADVASPVITFVVSGGACGPASSQNRCYVDAFKFTEVNPCLGVAGDIFVSGPLAEGQTNVTVTAVDGAATNISVFADGTLIGEKTSGIVAGTNVVATAALVKGQGITARQTKAGCSSAPGSPLITGGGANPTVKVFISCWKDATYAGPIGTNSAAPGSGVYYCLKGTGLTSGSQSAPKGGEILTPGSCWQTVTFNHASDSGIQMDNGTVLNTFDPYCALDGVVFAITDPGQADPDPDSGPYDIYIDQIMNGDVVIEDFEGYAAGTTNRFSAPNKQTVNPSPAATYLSGINSSLISTNNAFDGTKSCRIQWQWNGTSNIRWARVQANATTGKNYPQLDTTKPITIRYLILPVGQTTNKLSFPNLVNQNKTIGDSVTFNGAAKGDGPFTYQWQRGGSDITGATGSTYTKNNLVVSDAGLYSVVATGTSCTSTGNVVLAVSDIIAPAPLSSSYNSSTKMLTLSWTAPGFVLQQATALTGRASDWSDVPGASSPFQISAGTGARYYQLKHP